MKRFPLCSGRGEPLVRADSFDLSGNAENLVLRSRAGTMKGLTVSSDGESGMWTRPVAGTVAGPAGDIARHAGVPAATGLAETRRIIAELDKED